MTKDEAVELVYRSLPYSSQISGLDITSEESAIRFCWRGGKYRMSFYEQGGIGGVETVDGGMLVGDRESILLQSLLKRTSIDKRPASVFH